MCSEYVLSVSEEVAFLLRSLLWPGPAHSIFASQYRESAGNGRSENGKHETASIDIGGDLKIGGQRVW